VSGRAIVNILFGIVVVALLAGGAVEVYNAGVTAGIVEAGRVPVGAVAPYAGYGYGYGFHGGFGFLGLLFPILFLFLIFGLVRAAFGRGRGHGWGPGYKGWGPGGMNPDGWRDQREQYIGELHRKLHESDAGGSTPSSGGAGAGGPGSSSGA